MKILLIDPFILAFQQSNVIDDLTHANGVSDQQVRSANGKWKVVPSVAASIRDLNWFDFLYTLNDRFRVNFCVPSMANTIRQVASGIYAWPESSPLHHQRRPFCHGCVVSGFFWQTTTTIDVYGAGRFDLC
jgi:hypothetical protein